MEQNTGRKTGIRFSDWWHAAWIVFPDGTHGPLCRSFSATVDAINELYAYNRITDEEYVALKCSLHFSRHVFKARVSDVLITESRRYLLLQSTN